MKKLLLCVLLAGLSVSLFAQQGVHKTFSGDYLLSDAGIMGKATYSYYEDEKGNYVKDGKFTLTVDVRFANKVGTTSSMKTVINGNYKDGLMNGTWSWNVSCVDYPDNADVCTTTTKKMTGSFLNGLPDGQWNYNSAPQKKRKILVKTYWPTTYKFGEYYTSNNVSGSCQISFKNGYATGVVSSDCLGSVKGQYKEPNCPIGKWSCAGINEVVTEATFQNGYLTSKLIRRDGRVLSRTEWPEAVVTATKKVASGEIKEEDLEGFVVEENNMSGIYDVDLLLNDASFYRKDLEGDKTPTYGAIYGKYKQVLQIKYDDWNEILEKNTTWLKHDPYKSKVEFYEKYLNSIYIRKEDKIEIKKLIEECNEEIAKEPIKLALVKGIKDSIDLCKNKDFSKEIPNLPYNVSNESARKVYKLFCQEIKRVREVCDKKTSLLDYRGYTSENSVENIYEYKHNQYIERYTLEDITNVANKKREDIKYILEQEKELNRVSEGLKRFVDLESQNTAIKSSVLTDFGLASNIRTSGVLPYLHIAFEHMLNNNCSLDEYMEVITAASQVKDTNKEIQKKFKPLKKSPSGIIEMIKTYK